MKHKLKRKGKPIMKYKVIENWEPPEDEEAPIDWNLSIRVDCSQVTTAREEVEELSKAVKQAYSLVNEIARKLSELTVAWNWSTSDIHE